MKIDETAVPDSPATRDAILSAATELFAARGFAGVSLRQIADKSGAMLGSVTHFFPRKADLYGAVLAASSVRASARIHAALGLDGPAEDRFAAVCRAVFEGFTSDDPDFRIVDRANFGGEEGVMTAAIGPSFMEGHGKMIALLAELGIGGSGECPADWVVSFVFSLSYGAAKLHRQHRTFLPLDDPRALGGFVDAAIHFARGGASAIGTRIAS